MLCSDLLRKAGIFMKKVSHVRLTVNILITIAASAVYYFFFLPPINFKSGDFWAFFMFVLIVFSVLTVIGVGTSAVQDRTLRGTGAYLWKNLRIPLILAALGALVCIVGAITSAVIFNSSRYSSLLSLTEGDFAKDVTEITYDEIPMLDEDSSNTLANRKLGELSDLVSQFEVDDESAQINYRGKPIRVSYLNYGDFFKWINNRKEGIPAYLIVDMVTQEVTVERLEQGMKYTPSEPFFRNIDRHLRFRYPTLMFDDVNFEIDEDGTPYFVASVVDKTIGLFGGTDVKGAVLVNAVTGESDYYAIADVPSWVDRAHTASLIISQYDYYGRYHNGYWNSVFGQAGCTMTTDGYNYIAQDDDVWVYTGITSVGGDESNVGFILVNQRTKEAKFYSVAGAEEFSAMNSAEGSVQQYKYSATFPLLLNVDGQPTYFMALKDASQLVKMYAMVNVQQYQIVSNGYSLSECETNYHNLLVGNGVISGEEIEEPDERTVEVTGQISQIRSAVVDGTTVYFVSLSGNDGTYYRLSAEENEKAVLLNIGESITLLIKENDNSGTEIIPALMK